MANPGPTSTSRGPLALAPPGLLALLIAAALPPVGPRPVLADDATGVEFFEAKIRPVLVDRCYKCHSAGEGAKIKAGLRLDASSSIRAGGDSGPILAEDGADPSEAILLVALSHSGDAAAMPPDAKLPEKTLADFRSWVERGAPMPDFAPAASTASAASSNAKKAIDFDAGRQFWSIRPALEHPAPVTSRPDWARTAIDPFVLKALDDKGWKPTPEASRRALIRRLSFDLTGLPPTAAEVAAFVDDPDPDAYDRLVDRLLASPRYGERWGRHWLDVARFGEDNPTSEATSKPFRNAHKYRDWVIEAINADLPYDEFVRRQLAADLEPGLPPSELAATGLLGLSPIYHKEPKLSAEVIGTIVADEWDERLDTVTRGVLGLTVACARCHDHKFDPIGTADYYAIAGVMASTQQVDRPLEETDLDTQKRLADNRLALIDLGLRLEYAKEQKGVAEKTKGDVDKYKRDITDLEERIKSVRDQPKYDGPTAPGVRDAGLWVDGSDPTWTSLDYRAGEGRDLPIFLRGAVGSPGPITPRRFLEVLSPGTPAPFGAGSGRLALANAIFSDAKSLAARVIVNRVWGWHFGRPIVATPSNFGKLGEAPSHPELLDDLASRFIKAGWSLKWLHREIVRSSTYRQSSRGEGADLARQADPENKFLARMDRRRLDVEAWRDAMLAVDGSIDLDRVGGRSGDLDKDDFLRRTVYGKVSRQRLADVLKAFDFPDPQRHGESRDRTTTPIQQLYYLNSPFLVDRAYNLAKKAAADNPSGDPAGRVKALYLLALQRDPTTDEVARALKFVELDGGLDKDDSWRAFAQAVLITNEFLFVD